MASVSSLGIGSGLDLSSIVSGLTEAERAPTESRLSFREQVATTELSAFGLLKSSLAGFQGSLSSLKSSSTYNSKQISLSSQSLFTATALSSADVGSYSVEVSALANNHTLASSAATAFTSVDDTVGTGTLSIQFGTTTTGPYSFTQNTEKATQNITLSAANENTTLSGLRDYINEGDYGVQASIVNDGTGFRLTLTSEDSGAASSMEITVASDGDGNDDDNAGLSQLAFNASAQSSMLQTVAAQDAALTINGLSITRDTNTVIGAIDGVTLKLTDADVGNAVSVTVAEDTSAIKTAIDDFVVSYNGFVETVNSLTNFNSNTGDAGIFISDFTVRNVTRQIRSAVTDEIAQLTGNVNALTAIGITTSSEGTLEFDSSKLDSALENDPAEVAALFALQGRPSDDGVSYSTASDDTLAGEYAINISTLATQGVFNGTTANSLIIDANNDNFTVRIDGVTSSQILLTQDTYADGDTLAAHIQAQINDDETLKDSGRSVVVTYDDINNEFDITSIRYGSESTVEFTAIDTNTTNDLGFSVATGITGVDVAGTIGGSAATGIGQKLTGSSGDSLGLTLFVSSGSTGNRGVVSFSRGIAETLDILLGGILENDGLIDSRVDGLNAQLEDIADERVQLDLRVSNLEARLISQFSALDSLIARFNSTSNFLTQQLANLPRPNSINDN